MTLMFSALRDKSIDLPDKRTATIKDAWFDKETTRIHYLRMDLGGWLTSDEVLTTPWRLTIPKDREDRWIARMTEEDIAEAPRWPDSPGAAFSDWPAILIGPFGSTLSPPLLAAQIGAAGRSDWPSTANTSAPQLEAQFSSLSELISQPVFVSDGELGPVSDVEIDTDLWTLKALHVSDATSGTPLRAPMNVVRHRGGENGHIVLRGTKADFSAVTEPADETA